MQVAHIPAVLLRLGTEEQEKQIAEIRAVDYHETSGVGKLLAIIDDLQKQQPKRYTEAELINWHVEWMQRTPLPGQGREEFMLDFAHFLGMIKTEGES